MLPISKWNAFDFIYLLSFYVSFFFVTVLQSVSNAWRMRWTARERSPTTQVRDARLAAAAKPAAGMKWSQVTVHPESQPHTNTHTHTHIHTLSHCGVAGGERAIGSAVCVCVCASCGVCWLWDGNSCVGIISVSSSSSFFGGGVSASLIRLYGYDISEMAPSNSNGTSFVFSFLKIYSACPPQSISEVNHRWLIDTDSFNFISMCLLIMLTMYEGSRKTAYVCGFECWVLIHPGMRASVLWTPPHCHRAEDCKSVLLRSIFNQDSLSLHIRNRHRIVDRDRAKTCITYYSQVRTELKQGMSGHD